MDHDITSQIHLYIFQNTNNEIVKEGGGYQAGKTTLQTHLKIQITPPWCSRWCCTISAHAAASGTCRCFHLFLRLWRSEAETMASKIQYKLQSMTGRSTHNSNLVAFLSFCKIFLTVANSLCNPALASSLLPLSNTWYTVC